MILYFDFLKQFFEFPGNMPAVNLVILRTRAAFDRCDQRTRIYVPSE